MRKILALVVSGLHQHENTSGSTPVSQKQGSEAIMGTGAPKLDILENKLPALFLFFRSPVLISLLILGLGCQEWNLMCYPVVVGSQPQASMWGVF